MPFREHIDQLKAAQAMRQGAVATTKPKKPGRKPKGVAATMATIGKGLTTAERTVLSAPVQPPAAPVYRPGDKPLCDGPRDLPPSKPAPGTSWLLTDVVDPQWIKDHGGITKEVREHQNPPDVETIIGNFEVARIKALFDPKLFAVKAGRKPTDHHLYEIETNEHEQLREHLRSILAAVWLAAGKDLPHDNDEAALVIDEIERKVSAQLKVLVTNLGTCAYESLAYPTEGEPLLDMVTLIRSVWVHRIADGQGDVDPRECLDHAAYNMEDHQLQAFVDELRRQGRVT